jgi:hypothetical protein
MPKLKRLSIKQKKFVNNYLQTSNQTQSALHAYNTTSIGTAKTVANRNMRNPMIVEAIDQALKKNNITLEGQTDRLKEIANEWQPDKISSDTVLKANIELIKLLKGYPTTTKKVESKSIRVILNSKTYQELIDMHKTTSSEIEDILSNL